MKLILTVFSLLIFTGFASAQIASKLSDTSKIRICTPSRSHQITGMPWCVVISGKKKLCFNGVNASNIKPETIKSLNVLKDENAVSKYGNSARNGVIEIYLDNQKYPKAFKEFMKLYRSGT